MVTEHPRVARPLARGDKAAGLAGLSNSELLAESGNVEACVSGPK